jgi:low temperature requirement protein LtrA
MRGDGMWTAKNNMLRAASANQRVTYIELFFDLVFVFAITQLSHTLLEDLTALGAMRALLLLMAVWWVWIFTSWVANWLDPDRAPVRLLLLVLMLAGLVLSASLPHAFDTHALAFAGAYVFMQVGRSLYMVWALARHHRGNARNFQRITAWFAFAGVFWIAGAFALPDIRLFLWIVALGIEYGGPTLGFSTPGLGRSKASEWDINPAHLAERCALFIIIALGESIVMIGATSARVELSPATVAAFAASFVSSIAMWWIYFDTGADRASHRFESSDNPGRLARLAYTYIHLVLVAAIIVCAVGDEKVIAHPSGHADTKTAAILILGPALYIVGNILFKRTTTGRWPLSHLVGLALSAALVPFAATASPVALSVAATAVLVVVGVWETVSLRNLMPTKDKAG